MASKNSLCISCSPGLINDDQDIKLLGYKTKDELIKYAKLCGKTCLPVESVRVMYLKITGRPFEDLEDNINRSKIKTIHNTTKVFNKFLFIDFSNDYFKRIDVDKTFFYNEKGIFFESEITPKTNVFIFNIILVEEDAGEFKEIRLFSDWLNTKNNYFKIKKISNFGKYYISYKKLSTLKNIVQPTAAVVTTTQTNQQQPTKKELEKIESDKALENISKNLKEIALNEKARNLLTNMKDTKNTDEDLILNHLQNIKKQIVVNENIVSTSLETIDTFIKPERSNTLQTT